MIWSKLDRSFGTVLIHLHKIRAMIDVILKLLTHSDELAIRICERLRITYYRFTRPVR